MTLYTVEHRYTAQVVEAQGHSDAMHAAMMANYGRGLSARDMGGLMAVTDHDTGCVSLSHAAWVEVALLQRPCPEGATVPAEAQAEADRLTGTPAPAPKLPPRRARGMTLSYDSGDLFVQRLGYTGSLLMASNEGYLTDHMDREMELSVADMMVVDEWMDHFDAYFDANGWATWEDLHG